MTLAETISSKIPAAMLERVVFDQGILDASQRSALFKASGLSPQEIAQKTVHAYGVNASKLAFGLYEQVYETDWETARLLFEHFKSRPETFYYNHQASLIGHIPTLPLADLSEFLDAVKRQVCLIVSRRGSNGPVVRGTGFLVAPDLVLTCRHVLKNFPTSDNVLVNGNRIELYFDFHYGEPVEDVGASLPRARKVGLHPNWHVASGDDTAPDGLDGILSDADRARISKSLDFVLLRLDQPVGLQPLERGGGRRRGWVTLPPDTVSQALQPKDWIIIPQHPNGFPQRIDLGRFREPDQTGTRIRYSTNTANGTSGAPCFNQKFALVGVHNAYVGPPDKPLANQAIRFDHIAALVRPLTDAVSSLDRHVQRWSTSRANEDPHVILGREKLLAWLKASATGNPRSLAERVYAAQASVKCAGCTFTSDVLHAEIRDSRTPRAVYGGRGQQLPATPEDFLISLIRELGIDATQLECPKRPGARTGEKGALPLVGEVDKLERWLSDELPNWLGEVITRHVEKEIDARLAAQQSMEIYKSQGLKPPEEVEEKATANHPINIRPNSWDFAYVVIDDLRAANYPGTAARTDFTGEVGSLIAGLVKGKPEQAMHPGLRRLRWIFLGYVPDFIAVAQADGNGATVEALDPAAVADNEVLGIFDRMSQAHLKLGEGLAVARASVGFIVQAAVSHGNPETRLVELQRTVSDWCGKLLKEIAN